MKAINDRATIYDWLYKVDTKELCLPTFQRKRVWSRTLARGLIEGLILDGDSPVGTFLVLRVDPHKTIFNIRTMDGSDLPKNTCNSLLLDGQQRLSALWYALLDTEENRTYYISFNGSYEIDGVKDYQKYSKSQKNPGQNHSLYNNSVKQYQNGLFPVRLLNPLEESDVVEGWLSELKPLSLSSSEFNAVKRLIKDTRKIFGRASGIGRVIPFFELPQETSLNKAIQIYKTINKNSVRLSAHYLAIATMAGKVRESLYKIADDLESKVPAIKSLERDDTTELILKISCLLEDPPKPPSGSNYENLDFKGLVKNVGRITKGVIWAVKKLEELGIWSEKFLPSSVPLRVLPALHDYLPKESDSDYAKANKIVERYLWHAFLTRRYDRQVDDRLKEDFVGLKNCFDSGCKKIDVPIFDKGKNPQIEEGDIIETSWPTKRSIIARGIVLVCCQGGAVSLNRDENISEANCEKRQHHHIFPQSKLSDEMEARGNSAANCMLVPDVDNNKYRDALPGDYFKGIREEERHYSLSEMVVVKRLKTHLISEESAEALVNITQERFDGKEKDLDTALNNFLESRAYDIKKEIDKLLSGRGER